MDKETTTGNVLTKERLALTSVSTVVAPIHVYFSDFNVMIGDAFGVCNRTMHRTLHHLVDNDFCDIERNVRSDLGKTVFSNEKKEKLPSLHSMRINVIFLRNFDLNINALKKKY